MYKLESISSSNLSIIDNFNLNKEYLDELMEIYCNKNIFKKLLLSKNIKYIKDETNYIGFLWFTKLNYKTYKVHCIKINDKYNSYNKYEELFEIFNDSSTVQIGDNNNLNKELMMNLGFYIERAIVEMFINLDDKKQIPTELANNFLKFIDGKDEGIRCYIQNKVFHSVNRQAIEEEDVVFEKMQNYYISNGCIFIEDKGEKVGYGQLVKKDEKIFLANFGIVPQHRSKGFGRALLRKILSVAAEELYCDRLYLRCDKDNLDAINLYKSEGFIPIETYYQYKRDN